MSVKQIQVIPSQTELISETGSVIRRGTYTNLPYNKNILTKVHAIVDKEFAGDLNMFDDSELILPSIEDLQKLLSQVVIRFDNDPNYYTKKDYYYLIWYLCQSLVYLSNSGQLSESDLTELQEEVSQLKTRIESEIDPTLQDILVRLEELEDAGKNQLPGRFDAILERIEALEEVVDQKQDMLSTGSGIKLEDNTISAKSTESFKVSNVNIGGYKDGMIIDENTPILEILKTILQKTVDVKANAPIVKLTGDNYKAEYGSETTKTSTITLTQGSFTSADTTSWTTNQKMDCKLQGVTDDWEWSISEDGMKATSTNTYVATSVQTFSVSSVSISQNTIIPKKSNGENSDVSYNNTSLSVSGSIKVTPYYKLYFGPIVATNITSIIASDVKQLENTLQADFPLSSKTTTGSYTGKGKSILIACPESYKLDGITDGMGNSILALFQQTIQIDIPCGNGVPVKYNLYLYPISNGAEQAYKNLTFKLV